MVLLLMALLASSAAFKLAEPGSDEVHHHHEHSGGHSAEHGHGHNHGHDHDHEHEHEHSHELDREGKAAAEAINGFLGDIFSEPEVAESLAAAVARGGVDFSDATLITGDDGILKSCVEKEEIREELRWADNFQTIFCCC